MTNSAVLCVCCVFNKKKIFDWCCKVHEVSHFSHTKCKSTDVEWSAHLKLCIRHTRWTYSVCLSGSNCSHQDMCSFIICKQGFISIHWLSPCIVHICVWSMCRIHWKRNWYSESTLAKRLIQIGKWFYLFILTMGDATQEIMRLLQVQVLFLMLWSCHTECEIVLPKLCIS